MPTPLITPEILKGTRDFGPQEMTRRDYVMNKLKEVFASFGYDSIETPAIEYAKTLLNKYGDEGSKLIYSFEDNGGRNIALRYDQTVPFARYVAANYKTLPMPFKRYQIGRVWRADKPAKGRFREFYQCDIDIIGTTNLLAEGEIAQIMWSALDRLGFKNIVIKFNSRRLMNSILSGFSIAPADQVSIIRILDKLEKVGAVQIEKELLAVISSELIQTLLRIFSFKGTNSEKIKFLEKYDTTEIEEFIKLCKNLGIQGDVMQFDPSLARGLDYYTGITYEAFVKDVAIGAVCAGGRYDNLCEQFSKEKLSGVGVAFGFDRIVMALEELSLLGEAQLNSTALVTYFDDSTVETTLKLANDMRRAGISTEIYFEPASLGKQLKYADKKKIPFVIICGPDEQAAGEVTIRVMEGSKQKRIPAGQVILYIKGYSSYGKE